MSPDLAAETTPAADSASPQVEDPKEVIPVQPTAQAAIPPPVVPVSASPKKSNSKKKKKGTAKGSVPVVKAAAPSTPVEAAEPLSMAPSETLSIEVPPMEDWLEGGAVSPYRGYPHLKVLLVDDDPVNQMMIGHLLERLRIAPDTCGSGEFAAEMAERIPYDLIVMDLQLPLGADLDAIARIRSLKADGSPVILAQCAASKAEAGQIRKAGANDLLPKPLRIDDLTALLERHFP
jgi:CheY-like chemotaxis protein